MARELITVAGVSKKYHLYETPFHRLQEALHPFGKKYHQDFFALKDVSLSIAENQSVGIIGMNGSGKSTLLKIITGVLTPTTGHVRLEGRLSALLELGAGFNPEFTGIENINLQCSLQGYTRKQTAAMTPEILDFADIGFFAEQAVKTYSSGMYVRLAFAVAIHVDPDILIVDEALAVGDAYFQAKCLAKIRSFQKAGKTLLFVSHDPAAVKTLCDKAYLLHQGQLVDEGKPDKVFDYYNALIAEKEARLSEAPEAKLAKRQRSGNGKMEIEAVTILNALGQESETLVSGEAVQIQIRARAHEAIDNPTFGIMIRDRLGNDIFGVNSHGLGMSVGLCQKGHTLTVTYRIKLNLGPNIYNLTVAIHSEATHIEQSYDWINNARVFRVIPSGDLTFLGSCRLIPEFAVEFF